MANDDNKNKDQNVDDFDFSDMDWAKSGEESTGASTKSSSLGDDDPFNSSSEDDGFGGNDSFYSLEQMPDADNAPSDFGDAGNYDDAFGDIRTDEQPTSYDFGDTETRPAAAAGPSGFEDEGETDPFASDSESFTSQDDGVSDPFATEAAEAGEDTAAGDEAVAEQKPSGSSKKVLYALTAAAVLGAAGVFYALPMFMGTEQSPQVAATAPVSDPAQFPSTLPGIDTAGQEVATAVPPAVETTLPSLGQPPLENPVAPADTPLAIPALEDAPTTDAVAEVPPAVEPVVVPEAAKPVEPVDEMVGGSDRGGIDAMKDKPASVPASTSETPAELASILSRLNSLEGRVEKLADSFDNYVEMNPERPAAAASAAEDTREEQRPAPQGDDVVPPMKPPIIEGASLKGIAGDLAWIGTRSGVVEVRIGDEVPKGGKVVAFKNYRGSWIVVTTDGLIVRQ